MKNLNKLKIVVITIATAAAMVAYKLWWEKKNKPAPKATADDDKRQWN